MIHAARLAGTAPEALELLGAMEAYVARLYGPLAAERTSVVEPAEMAPPSGVYVVLREDGAAVAGGGVRGLEPAGAGAGAAAGAGVGVGVGEVKRMFVRPEVRGRGLGRLLLAELEAAARDLGHQVLRLDTAGTLPRFYEAAGYRAITDYNGNTYATYWREKALG